MASEEPATAPGASANQSRASLQAPLRFPNIENTWTVSLKTEAIPVTPTSASAPAGNEAAGRTVQVDESADGSMTFGPIRRTSTNRLSEVPETPPVRVPMLLSPTTSRSSYFLEVIDFDQDEDMLHFGTKFPFVGANWKFDRGQRKEVQGQAVPLIVCRSCHRGRRHYVSKSKASFGQVLLFGSLTRKNLSLISNGAVRILAARKRGVQATLS